MAKEFFKIMEKRIRNNTIKSYLPTGEKGLNVYYNSSRYKIEVESFTFPNEEARDEKLAELDLNFGI